MWYPPKVTTPPSEPVTVDEAKRHLNVLHTDDNAVIEALIAAARDHVERYTGTLIGTQAVELKCDCFRDLDRLPVAPVQSVTSISYTDTAGATQTVDNSLFEPRFDCLEASIVRKYGQQWPGTQPGSRVTVSVAAGYQQLPTAIRHAVLLWIAEAYEQRENASSAGYTAFDALLSNYRRGA